MEERLYIKVKSGNSDKARIKALNQIFKPQTSNDLLNSNSMMN